MKHHPYTALLVLMIAALACAVPGTAPEPTATPVPSNTPAPTATPLPTATATLPPTSTPDAAATAAVMATQSAADVLDELDNLLSDSDIPYKDGQLAWRQNSPLAIKMRGPSQNFLDIDETLSAGNFILKSDVTWEATGILICGAVFRSEPNIEKGKQYQFVYLRLSGLPVWAIELHEFGYSKNSPTGTKASNALNLKNGATNQFVLVVQDDNFTVYLNGVRQGRYFDYSKQRESGYFGFYGWQDSGDGVCEYENSWIWSLD
ncbi:MAG: hypothetical protein C3F07_15020 [Anaerolineales bacterium]|nr:hypothetical protein [Anaerolineae bacterium]PWB71144.1 MAG: hypothetical protein C3F07_15020 [Anaerolineales bacterium]